MSASPLRTFVASTCSAIAVGLLLTAAPALGATQTFSNVNAITVPSGAPGTTSGNASPYPSSISVSGMGGSITDIDVNLDSFTHTNPDDLDILLVSPRGDSTVLMSDACGGTDTSNFDWTFDDDAAALMPDAPAGACVSFTYKPSSYDSGDTWPTAFPGPHGTTMSRFNGENPNGAWNLYVRDDAGGDVGDIEGWSITITTGPFNNRIPATGTSGKASLYPATQNVAGRTGIVDDVNLSFAGLSHQHPDDLDMLLVGPEGQKVLFMSDACGSYDINSFFWTWDDEAAALMPDSGSTNICGAFGHKPSNYDGNPDTFPAPAPAGPYASTMSAFDFTDANGVWSVYINDDGAGDEGYLVSPFTLEISTREKAGTKFSPATAKLEEGTSSSLTITRSATSAVGPATVLVNSTPGTATSGVDYARLTDVPVSFAAGEESKTVEIAALNDSVREGDETFNVTLSSPTGDAVLASPTTAVVTIPGDLAKPQFSIASKKLTLGKGRKVGVKVGAATNETKATKVKVVLKAKLGKGKAKSIGSKKGLKGQPGKSLAAKVKISKKAAAALKENGSLKVTIEVTVTDAAGNVTKQTKSVKLKPKPAKKKKKK